MDGIPGTVRLSVRLGPDREPTSLEVSGTFDPNTGDFTYHPLGRGGQEKVIHNAENMLIRDEPAQSSEPAA